LAAPLRDSEHATCCCGTFATIEPRFNQSDAWWRRSPGQSLVALAFGSGDHEVATESVRVPTRQRKVPKCKAFREADDGARTRDTWLGKPVLYRLSYVRAPRILAA
jgi:hypothetical protein